MTAAMPSYGKIKSNAADSASNRNAKPTAQAREKGGRVVQHPTEDTNVPLPPLADDLTVSLSSRKSRLSSSGRQRRQSDQSDTHDLHSIWGAGR